MIIAFDLFGTVFDMSNIPKENVKNYLNHIRQEKWSPLKLPLLWEFLMPFPDSVEGINLLRKEFLVVTCSNAPLGVQIRLSKFGNIRFDGFIPLELNRVFKTNPKAYLTICDVLMVEPKEVMMVTANESFGDIEAAKALGMQTRLIKRPKYTILDLAKELEI